MAKTTAREYYYPEIKAGGFSHVDTTVDFYLRINALLKPEMVVLDFGAGRGAESESERAVTYAGKLRTIKGKVEKFIGADIDPAVNANPFIDEAIVIIPDAPIPLPDQSIDLIISDWVFEHIENTDFVISELDRILKPGGWICARTPNRWGYIAIAATLIPKKLHRAVLRRVQPKRKEMDVFPKFYKLNTQRSVKKQFEKCNFESFIYTINSEPGYSSNSKMLWHAFHLLFKLTPSRFNAVLHIFLKKS